MNAVVYIHGKGGSAEEAIHYAPLFPGFNVIGFDYKKETPWEAGAEIHEFIEKTHQKCDKIYLIANSIGAFFAMNAKIDNYISKAYFISPIVDMKQLIDNMMKYAHVSEEQLKEAGTIETDFGETLSWQYYSYVINNPMAWNVKTHILYGDQDQLTDLKTIETFAKTHDASLTIMEDGEHWFHTKAQMDFLDQWILTI